jgi:hypothetical protein
MVWIGQSSKNVHSHMELIEWTHGNTLLKDQLKNQFLWIQFILIILKCTETKLLCQGITMPVNWQRALIYLATDILICLLIRNHIWGIKEVEA